MKDIINRIISTISLPNGRVGVGLFLLAITSLAAHAQVFDVSITPSDGSEVFTKTSATSIEIKPGDSSPILVFSGNSDLQGESLNVNHDVRYDFALTPVKTINQGNDGGLPEGNFSANAKAMTAEGITTNVEEPSFTEPALTGPALVLMLEEGDPIIYYAEDAQDGKIKLRCNPNGQYMVGNVVVDKVIAVFYKDAHTSTAHPAVEPTSEADGNIDYWSCAADGCGKYFADEGCTEEITENSWVRTMVAGTIKWEDNDNTDGKRPEAVKITIFANGSDWDDITVTSSVDWVISVTDLPKYNQKQEIVYSISAPTVKGYTSEKTGNDVTYTIVPATMSLDDTTDPTSTLQALVAANATQDITLTGRTLYKDGYYNTLCLPFALSAEQLEDDNCPLKGCTLKEVTDASLNTETNVMTIELAEATALEAGKPYLVKWEAASENIVEPTFTEVKITKSEPSTIEGDNLDVMGIFAPKTMALSDTDLFFLGAENKFYTSNAEEGANLKGYRCFFKAKSAGSAKALTFVLDEDEATGISQIENGKLKMENCKIIENGKIVIIKNGKKYNLNGQILK